MHLNFEKYYYQPQSHIFIIFEFINKHIKLILVLMLFAILFYPSYQLIYNSMQHNKNKTQLAQLTLEIEQKNKLYESLKNRYQNTNNQNVLMIEMNKLLKDTLLKHNVKIENILWEENQQKQIHLYALATSKAIFPAIHALTEFKKIQFISLDLTRLEEEKQIRLEAQIMIQEDNE